MGQSSSNTSSQSTTQPGALTAPTVQGITSQLNPLISNSGTTPIQQQGIAQLTANGLAGDQFAPQITNNATALLNGGGATSQNTDLASNLADLKTNIGGIAAPNYSTVNSPQVAAALQAVNSNISDSVNGQFAAAGRQGSGYNQRAIAEGESLADAPILLNQANTDTASRLAAANTLYGAGNATSNSITSNNQTALGNQVQGTTQAGQALNAQNWGPTAAIEAQELGQSIPAQNLGLLAQIGIPLAGLNTTTSGAGSTTNNPSFIQDLQGIGGAFGGIGTGLGSRGGVNAAGQTVAGSGILGFLGGL